LKQIRKRKLLLNPFGFHGVKITSSSINKKPAMLMSDSTRREIKRLRKTNGKIQQNTKKAICGTQ
jgi:hypothetical protein